MNSIQIFFLLLSFLMTISSNKAYKQASFKIIRKVGGNITCEDLKRTADLEYPRQNLKILEKLKRSWENYYKCLKLHADVQGKPEIRRLQQGQYTEFSCEICPRPFQNYEELEWKYKPLFPKGEDTKPLQNPPLTPQIVLTFNKTLQIFNVQKSFGGVYVCYRKQSVLSVYILEVSSTDSLEKYVWKINTDNLRTAKTCFQISYAWSDWTECNACGRVGKKFKYGTCYVLLRKGYEETIEKHIRQRSLKYTSHFVTSQDQALKRKFLGKQGPKNLVSRENLREISEAELIDKFSTGIPCASRHLPKSVSDIIGTVTAVKVLVEYCWEPCEKTEIFLAFDYTGKLVELANNSAGIYSMFQEFPQLPPEVERTTLLAEFGKDIIIHCPGTSLTNTPAVWKLNDKVLFPEIIAHDSKGRVTIDLLNRIHIRKLRLADSHTYSCWHKKQLVGTVCLNVEKKFSIRINHHIVLFLILMLLVIMLLVGKKLIKRELEMRRK